MSRRYLTGVVSALLLLQWKIVEAASNDTAPLLGTNSTLSTGNSTTKAGNATSAASNSTAKSTAKPKARPENPETVENWRIMRSFVWFWAAIIVVMILIAFINALIKYLRTITCLNNDNQRYFALPYRRWGLFKKYFIQAPLIRKRHHREFRLSSAINMGTLPSKAQTFFLLGYLLMMITLTCYNIPWHAKKEKVLVSLQKRTGLLTLSNLLPIFVLAFRNNPLIWVTGISFDTFNLFHRWLGRMVILEAITHGVCYIIYKVDKVGWEGFQNTLVHGKFVRHGFIVSQPRELTN